MGWTLEVLPLRYMEGLKQLGSFNTVEANDIALRMTLRISFQISSCHSALKARTHRVRASTGTTVTSCGRQTCQEITTHGIQPIWVSNA